jgi:hypothetical protein
MIKAPVALFGGQLPAPALSSSHCREASGSRGARRAKRRDMEDYTAGHAAQAFDAIAGKPLGDPARAADAFGSWPAGRQCLIGDREDVRFRDSRKGVTVERSLPLQGPAKGIEFT